MGCICCSESTVYLLSLFRGCICGECLPVVLVKIIHRLHCQDSWVILGEITFGSYLWVLSYSYICGDSFSVVMVGCASQYYYSVISVGSPLSVVSVSQGILLVVFVAIIGLVVLVPVYRLFFGPTGTCQYSVSMLLRFLFCRTGPISISFS